MLDLERSRLETATELEQLHDQKDELEGHLSMLKHSLIVIRSGASTPIPQDSMSKGNMNYFEEQQDLLKRELEQKMSRHAKVMESQRLVSHDSIQQLQRKLNNLEQVLCQSDARRPTTPSSELILNRSRTPTPAREFDIQEANRPSSEGPYPKRAYSPHRHSNQRLRPAGSASNIAEKGPSS
ncbi:hypothetical protein LSAT2_021339 [Lamellibrachia satsuma]|nr:hypothetical protein LSAT2_021339 [Lamellibrachia satsuma]